MKKNSEMELMDVLEVLKVPEVSEIVCYKINELKESPGFSALINAYEEKRKVFKEAVYDSYRRLWDRAGVDNGIRNKSGMGKTVYWFELLRFREDNWHVLGLEPAPPPYYDRWEILPRDIIDCVKEAPVNAGSVQTLSGVPSNLYEKSYDLQFIRFSLHYVCGSVRENRASLEERHKKERFSGNENLDIAYRVFFYYLQKFPEIREYFFNELFGKVGPLLEDSRLKGKDRADFI